MIISINEFRKIYEQSKKESDLIICDVQQNFSKFFNKEYIEQLKSYCKKFNRVFNIYDINDQQDPIQYDFPNLFNSYTKEYGGEIQEEDFEYYFDPATLKDITDKHNNKTLEIGDK
jgi:predicted methyltransferase